MVKAQRSTVATTGSDRSEASSISGVAAIFQRRARRRTAVSVLRAAMASAVDSTM